MNMKHFSVKAFLVYLFLATIALLHCPFSFAYEEEIKVISANMNVFFDGVKPYKPK